MSSRTSGDPTADRRFAYAMAYRQAGEITPAAELVAQALEVAPHWAAGWLVLGELREALEDREAAVEAYARSLSLDPQDSAGALPRLARLGAALQADALTPAHVASLFDDYAERFETSLVQALGYRGPALLLDAVTGLGSRRFARGLDLGCGTGLAGEVFAPLCDRLDGVDISERMLSEAERKGLYASLVKGEIVATLAAEADASADLILAADVLVYLGDLGPLFTEAARVLAPAGLFAATAQLKNTGEGFELGPDLRYRHSTPAMQAWASNAGFGIRYLAEAWARRDAGVPLPGLVFILEKLPRAS